MNNKTKTNKTKTNNKTKTKTNNKNKIKTKGGKVLASGGFGCVFTPSLKCLNSNKRYKNKVSKLMTRKHAKYEYDEIIAIKKLLKNINNYKDYFLLFDITLCKPNKLSKKDLIDYNTKCKALPKYDITKKNINDKLDKLMLLSMPNGGSTINDYIFNIYKNYDKLYDLNLKLINLLKKGILPMNSKNIYHNDIKDSNVLVDISEKEIKTRLIDWGLSTKYIPFKKQILPKSWKNRPLQFNVPFSVIIFTDTFIEEYNKFTTNNHNYKDENELIIFTLDYIKLWIIKRGAGHFNFINEIMYMLFSNNIHFTENENKFVIIDREYTTKYIINYIVKILINKNFYKDDKFNLRKYLDNVFIKNVDLWGFISIYYAFLELLFNNYDNLNKYEKKLFQLIKQIFIDYLYLNSDKVINTDNLVNELNNIGNIINIIRQN